MKLPQTCLIVVLTLATCYQTAYSTPLNERQARRSSKWVTDGVIYQIQPRAFTSEGTLKAATARLPKVAEIGVDILYLCPVFVADDCTDRKGWSPRQKASGTNNPRNPYRMKDYYHVDPEYGTDDDLKAFVAEAHRLGMRVLLDMVYLHCGPKAVFLEEHPDFVKRDKDGKVITAAWGFPAVNFANPQLREYLWKNMEYWIEKFDVDGFRCDVAGSIPLDFWETARRRLEKIRSDICMLSESRRREDQLKAFDLNYGFAWNKTLRNVVDKGKPVSAIRKTWETTAAARPRGARFIRYIDNHDIANDAFNNRIEKAWGTSRVDAALVMIFTLDGVPFLYNGQEVADTARHSIFGRMPIDWAGGDTPTGKSRHALCKKLCSLRHAEHALTAGKVVWLDNDAPEAVLSYLRVLDDERILTVVNLTGKAVNVKVSMPGEKESFNPLLEKGVKEQAGKGDKMAFEMEGNAYFVGKCSDANQTRHSTHFRFKKKGALIPYPSDMPIPGPFFTTLVPMKNVPGFPFDYALYFSTDHHNGKGGIWLYVCNGIPTDPANWKSYDKAVTDRDFDYLKKKPKANPIFIDRAQGHQTETPHVNVIDGTVYMTYHNSGAGNCQSTLLATSKDGVNFKRINGEKDSIILDYDPKKEPGNGHTGYFRWRPNPFPAVDYKYMGYSLHGGGDNFFGAMWGSNDAVKWDKIQIFDAIEGHAISEKDRIVRRRSIDPNSITSLGNGEFVALCSSGERSSGGRKRVLELYEVFLGADGRSLTRQCRKVLGNGPAGTFDAEEISDMTSVLIGDTWHLIYVGASKKARLNTIMSATGKLDLSALKSKKLQPGEQQKDFNRTGLVPSGVSGKSSRKE